MLLYVVIAAVLPALFLGYPATQCVGPPVGRPGPHAVRINNCTASPCNVQQGSNLTFQHDFTANQNSATLTMEIEQTVFGNSTTFPFPPALVNACNSMVGLGCPVVAGQNFTHASNIPINTAVHGGIPVQLRISLRTATGNYTGCTAVNMIVH